MSRALVRLDGIGKTYPALSRGGQAGAWWRALRGADHAVGKEVLKDISFAVEPGEAVAILGANGAGKSTLLKLVAGILVPAKGELIVRGRTGALLELGAGFTQELSGRQNLRNACVLAGMNSGQIAKATDAIIAFAGLEQAIDKPVKHYSSGMVVRLGFAILTELKPELLISDEVLAVGDESFQKKCITWVQQYLADGGTLLLVSHSVYHVQKLCNRAIWLHEGRIRQQGDVFGVTQAYLAWHENNSSAAADPAASKQLSLLGDVVANFDDATQNLQVSGTLAGTNRQLSLHLELRRTDGALVAASTLPCKPGRFTRQLSGEHRWLPGRLRLDLWLVNQDHQNQGHRISQLLQIAGDAREFGSVRLPHQWLAGDAVSS